MKKQILLMALSIYIFISLSSCSKENIEKEKDLMSKESIQDFAEKFFRTKYAILYSKTNVEIEKNNFSKLTDGGEWSTIMLLNIETDRNFLLQFGDFSYKAIEIKIRVDSIKKINDNLIEASINEVTNLTRNDGPDVSGLIETIISEHHTISIQNRGNSNWVLTSLMTQPFFRPSNWHATGPPGIGGGLPPVLPLKYYNGVMAANYAVKNVHRDTYGYAEPAEPCYFYFINGGGDCTNFVSYCLKEGGWVEDVLWKSGGYINCANSSHSWTVADDFVRYAINSERTTSFDIVVSETSIPYGQFYNLELGDIIAFDGDRNGTYDHNVIVTKKTNYGIYFTYHSNNTLDISVGEFLMKMKEQTGKMPKVKALKIRPTYR